MNTYQDGQLPFDQARILTAVARAIQPKIVLEIGTFFGHTTRALALALPGSIIHTLDLPPVVTPNPDLTDWHLINHRVIGREFQFPPALKSQILQHYGDSMNWDFSLASGATFFFIDGSHSYTYVRNDSEKCFDLCSGHGFLLWHDADTAHPGVIQLLREWKLAGRHILRLKSTPLACYMSPEFVPYCAQDSFPTLVDFS